MPADREQPRTHLEAQEHEARAREAREQRDHEAAVSIGETSWIDRSILARRIALRFSRRLIRCGASAALGRRLRGGSANLEPNSTGRHDPAAQAGARREDPVVSHLVGARWRDQRDETVDQRALLHQDVRGAVAPTRLQAKQKPAIRVLLQAIVRRGGRAT